VSEALQPPPSVALPDSDRTVLVPRPGGRAPPVRAPIALQAQGNDKTQVLEAAPARTGTAPAAAAAAPVRGTGLDVAAIRRHGSGLNPLVRAANPLLDLVVPLRYIAVQPNLDELRQNLVRAVKNFEGEARSCNIEAQSIAVARYALCTFLDETIASTPWGGEAWAGKSLLVAFHNEAWGGEKFFLILQRLAQEPGRHVDLLELMYLCLALGLEGRYRVLDGGRSQVESLRERLQKIIEGQRGPHAPALSVQWQASSEKRDALLNNVPIWGLAVAASIIILLVRMGFSLTLAQSATPVLEQLNGLHLNSMPLPVVAPAPPLRPPSISALLAPEIAHGFVTVREEPGEIKITLGGEAVFASGSAELVNSYKPILDRIGDLLKNTTGLVTVIGHTDSQPSGSARFRSNGELSLARAETVEAVLAARTGQAGRFQAEGNGDSDPVAPNDSPANRARNRRVDIVLAPDAANKAALAAAASASTSAPTGAQGATSR